MTAATAYADVIIQRQGNRYIEESNVFAPLTEIVVGGTDLHINGFGVFGQTSVDTNVKWVIFDSLASKSPAFLSASHAIVGTPGSYAANARWHDSPALDITLLANHRYAMGILADKLGPTGFRWGATATRNVYGGGSAVSENGLSMPFSTALANAGLAGSFYDTPRLYTFVGQSDPMQWSNAMQPSLRITAAIPEPGEWSMLLSGLLMIGVAAHRRKRHAPLR
jgi:hypothetical protein